MTGPVVVTTEAAPARTTFGLLQNAATRASARSCTCGTALPVGNHAEVHAAGIGLDGDVSTPARITMDMMGGNVSMRAPANLQRRHLGARARC